MNIVDIINKKNNKIELSKEEINFFVDNYLNDNISDEQMTLLLKSILKNDMTFEETYNLTIAMLNSGEIIDLSKIEGIKVDKHSSGGVGDKTTLVVCPLVASCGVKIAKMSGRGLGFTGGTIDKLESISNFKTNIDIDTFINQVNDINISIVSQSGNLVPADKKIYALRDVTGTAESIPLIASSIMSKKLASGSDKILLDVKVGKGAFTKNIDDARKLAKTMVEIGKKYGKETVAILTNMNYPLGNTIGNAIEVKEAIEVLDNKGNDRFTKLCLLIATYMVSMGKNIDIDRAFDEVNNNFKNKNGLIKLKEFITAQGGNISNIPVENNRYVIHSKQEGYIYDIDTIKLANLCNDLGAGRKNKNDIINPRVGIKLIKQVGDKVTIGEDLMYIYTKDEIDKEEYLKTIRIGNSFDKEIEIVYEIIK